MIEIIIAFAVGFVLGYVARKYVGKRWPDEMKALDDRAKGYATEAEQNLRDAADRARDARDKFKS